MQYSLSHDAANPQSANAANGSKQHY